MITHDLKVHLRWLLALLKAWPERTVTAVCKSLSTCSQSLSWPGQAVLLTGWFQSFQTGSGHILGAGLFIQALTVLQKSKTSS